MPTSLPRYTITETPEVAAVLDLAARRHPGQSRQQLLRTVILEAAVDQAAHVERERARLRSVLASPDPLLRGLRAAEELKRMREQDWPE